jgi:hypothetical protein
MFPYWCCFVRKNLPSLRTLDSLAYVAAAVTGPLLLDRAG